MNFFTHGRRFLDDGYLVAGVAVPDWLSAVDRKVRARSPKARACLTHEDPIVVEVARGVIQHHFDDRWFHSCEAFVMLNARLSKSLRGHLPEDDSLRSNFVAHITIELIMDACLIDRDPTQLNRYYELVDSYDFDAIDRAVSIIAQRPLDGRLAELIPKFIDARFLADYHDNTTLLSRLNNVLKRVTLDPLPEQTVEWLQVARREVTEKLPELLAGEQPHPAWME
jgi:hypothetical protein